MSSPTKSDVFVKLIYFRPTTPPSLRNTSTFRSKTDKQNKSQQSAMICLWESKQAFFSCLQTACVSLVICSWPGDRLCFLFLASSTTWCTIVTKKYFLTWKVVGFARGHAFLSFACAQHIESLHCCGLIPFTVHVIPPLCTSLLWSHRHIIQQFSGSLLTLFNLHPIFPAQQPPLSFNSWRISCSQRD